MEGQQLTLGEIRVRTKFNPTGSTEVDEAKRLGAELLNAASNYARIIRERGNTRFNEVSERVGLEGRKNDEGLRAFGKAQDLITNIEYDIETAVMYFVKGLTANN